MCMCEHQLYLVNYSPPASVHMPQLTQLLLSVLKTLPTHSDHLFYTHYFDIVNFNGTLQRGCSLIASVTANTFNMSNLFI